MALRAPIQRQALRSAVPGLRLGMSAPLIGSRYNSTDSSVSEIKSEIGQIAAEKIPEVVEAAKLVAPDQIGYFQSLGLAQTWYWPPDVFQHIFELMHVYSGLPWWGSIMAVTVGFRALLLPLYIKASDHSARMSAIKPELNKLTQQYTKVDDALEGQKLLVKRKKIMEASGIKTRFLLMPLLGIPFFIGIFSGINKMAAAKVFGMTTGGFGWFTDLTIPDPYLGLQVITAVVYAATIKMGGETGASPMSPGMKKIFTYMPFIAVPLTMGVPASTCLYFATNSFISVGQTLLLRSPKAREILGLHPIVTPVHDPAAENVSAFQTLKNTFDKAKERAEKMAREQEQEAKLKAEAQRAAANEKVFIQRGPSVSDKFKNQTVKKSGSLRG
ncbi:similar to Saccharomyces cerevisiae YER154W OXA1 Mitochondrial inner membrane insertase [Geotrichum candidum]|uniref:Similar to Saccharomyces cerevisiae YER154W OXA1 Mitochondrial inner membrane insertase n=1 Tax=Geotrichum candidum TaxID=1173061 RepID=A0A0J9X660_GEOCN|nr:similar to Saccharomyces cerevisiae YER154W OXA1 Mitochondrial inner membrane insertase [Geotrichum candidum]